MKLDTSNLISFEQAFSGYWLQHKFWEMKRLLRNHHIDICVLYMLEFILSFFVLLFEGFKFFFNINTFKVTENFSNVACSIRNKELFPIMKFTRIFIIIFICLLSGFQSLRNMTKNKTGQNTRVEENSKIRLENLELELQRQE